MLINGWQTLFYKEVLRFRKVLLQTIFAPILTSILYLLIFSHALKDRINIYDNVDYLTFLVPGLVMMSILQNSFANTSSSLVQSKIQGSLVFILLTPLNHYSWFLAFILAASCRGILVGLGVYLATLLFINPIFFNFIWIITFALLGAFILATLGLIAGLWADKFEQMTTFQNFLIMPLTFLAGVFYSIHSLPSFWQKISHLNPFFYMIDGFRFGFFGQSDINPWFSLSFVLIAWILLSFLALYLLKIGYKIRN